MRITFDQTESSVLSFGGIPVGFSESLQSGEILRNSLNSVLGVGLMFIVAVLNVPLSVLLVIQFSFNVSNNRGSNNISPLLDVTLSGKLIELEASLDLESGISHLIEETRGVSSISAVEFLTLIERKVLLASVNTSRVVVDVLRALFPEELLVLVVNNEFFETAVGFLTVQNERGRFVRRLLVLQVEAVVRLHGCEFRLLSTGSPGETIRNSVAINNIEVEVDIRVERDWLSSERRLGEGIAPSVVSWAGDSSLGSLFELLESKIPAGKNFTSAKVENLREALSLGMRVRNKSVVHQSGSPVNSSPVSSFAVITRSGSANINSNVREIF